MKTVFMYLMFVGFSLLALWGILRVGEGMATMFCIQGPWTMEVSKPSTSSSCNQQFREAEATAFSISQSGAQFSILFNNETIGVLQGEIKDIDLIASAPASSGSFLKGENSDEIIRMRATLDRQSKPARLWGVLSFANCPDLNFVATHQVVSPLKGE